MVESKKENIPSSPSILAKENVSLSLASDPLSKKEKIAKLKKEHEKPYVVIDKPEQILLRKLREKYSSNFKLEKSNGTNVY